MSEELIATGIVCSGVPAGIGQVVDVGLPGFTMVDLDTSHQGTTGGYRTFVPGKLATPGELVLTTKFSGNYPTPQVSGNNAMVIYIPSPTSPGLSGLGSGFAQVHFSGYLKAFQPAKASLDGIMMADSTIKVNGAITIA